MKYKNLFLIIPLVVISFMFVGCDNGITPQELAGEWNVVSITETVVRNGVEEKPKTDQPKDKTIKITKKQTQQKYQTNLDNLPPKGDWSVHREYIRFIPPFQQSIVYEGKIEGDKLTMKTEEIVGSGKKSNGTKTSIELKKS